MKKLLPKFLGIIFLLIFALLPRLNLDSSCQAFNLEPLDQSIEEVKETTTAAEVNLDLRSAEKPAVSVSLERLQTLREQLQEKRELIKEKRLEVRQTIREKLSERKKTAARKIFNRVVKRFELAITRLEKISDRLDSRLGKLKEQGLETVDLKADLDSLREKLTQTKASLEEAKQAWEDILDSDDPQANFSQVHDILKEIKNVLLEIHQGLSQLVEQIKALVREFNAVPSPAND